MPDAETQDRSNFCPNTPRPPHPTVAEEQLRIRAKLRGREDITIATWNVRTLRAAGKVEELLHEMDRYKWSILGLCEMRWKKSVEIPKDGGHRVYYTGKEDRHEHKWVS